MSTPILRRVSAAASVLALSAAAVFVAIAPAQAVTLPGNIDPAQPRTLTVHKYALGPGNGAVAGTGQELSGDALATLGTPLPGAVFTATQVADVDLTTAAGWTLANSLTPQSASSRLTGTPFTSTPSGANGTATFPSTMPLGLFYVQETVLPAGATNRTAPFLVSLPLPTGAAGAPANQWIYDVHVYPKNAVTQLTKTRVPAPENSVEARNPDLIRWSINSTIPTLATGDAIENFSITDTVPAELALLDSRPTGVAATALTVRNAAGVAQNFVFGTDYTIVRTPDSATFAFTSTALPRLTNLQGGTVNVSLLTRAVTIPANGLITNSATATINGDTTSVTATTAVGELTIFAFASNNGGQRVPLAGAVYQVYLSQNDANLGQNPISVDGVSSWTTGANGTAVVPIMTPGNYYVRELTPPAGYNLPTPSIVQTVVVPGPSSATGAVQNYVEFNRTQVSAANFLLPLTGGDGAVWFGVGGSALVVIALGAAFVVSRRRAATEHVTA